MTIAPEAVFHDSEYLRINAARLRHLATVLESIDVSGMSVLELGAGIGDHTQFWIERGCVVTTSEARPENLEVLRARFPTIDVREIDLCRSPLPNGEEQFDIVYAYGVLYHLQDPERGLEYISAACRHLAFIETCVSFGDMSAINSVAEPSGLPTQSTSGTGCRPTRRWVYDNLSVRFAHVYQPGTQPDHEQFPLDWSAADPDPSSLVRTTFVASRSVLDGSGLYRRLLERQSIARKTVPSDTLAKLMASLGIRNVLDVGANVGQFAQGLRAQGYRDYIVSFEPIQSALEDLTRVAAGDPFWDVHGLALGAREGTAHLNISENLVSSSFLDIEERTVSAEPSTRYKGTSSVEVETIDRLWPSLQARFCTGAVMLKLDVQGYEAHVLAGAEVVLEQFALILVECSLVPIYTNETILADMLPSMKDRGLYPVWMRTGWHNEITGQIYQCDVAFARSPDVSASERSAAVEPVPTPGEAASPLPDVSRWKALYPIRDGVDGECPEGTED